MIVVVDIQNLQGHWNVLWIREFIPWNVQKETAPIAGPVFQTASVCTELSAPSEAERKYHWCYIAFNSSSTGVGKAKVWLTFWTVHLFICSFAEISNGFAFRIQPEYLQKQRGTVTEKHATITPSMHKSLFLLHCASKVKKAKTAKEKNIGLNRVLSSSKQNVVSFVADFYPAAAKYQSDIKGKIPIN